MNRIFVALRPPPDIRAALTALMSGVEGARWQTDNQLHLTLAFIGEVDRHGLEAAAQALSTIRRPPLVLQLGPPGSFEAQRADRTSTLWVSVTEESRRGLGPDPLTALAQAIRTALQRAGLPTETRRFVPHITLARFGQSGAPREALRPWLSTVRIPPLRWQAETFHLVESRMGTGGSHYEPLASYQLEQAASPQGRGWDGTEP